MGGLNPQPIAYHPYPAQPDIALLCINIVIIIITWIALPGLACYSLLSAYGIQLNPTCRDSIILSLENDGGFLYPLIDK
jgi:hypothetical protein